jgi:hypothetical protein
MKLTKQIELARRRQMMDFTDKEDDKHTTLEAVVDINKQLKVLLDKITDLEWEDKDATDLWKEYHELIELRDKGETHYLRY